MKEDVEMLSEQMFSSIIYDVLKILAIQHFKLEQKNVYIVEFSLAIKTV